VKINHYWCPVALGQSRDDPMTWSWTVGCFCIHIDVRALSHGSKPWAGRIASFRAPSWPVNSRGVTGVRRVCLLGWNAAYRSPGISHFFLVQHFKHKRDIVTVPRATRRGAWGEKIPFLASLCLRLRLYKSSGFVWLLGQVWALVLWCEVISVMRTQECTLSDFPPGFSFSESCNRRLWLPSGLADRDVPREHQ